MLLRNATGFSLIELMIALVIAGIIAAIAIPSYNNFVTKSKMRAAQADLVSLSVNIENTYQRQLAYPVIAADADVGALYAGWKPTSESSEFAFSAESTAAGYTLTATGQGSMSGCSIALTSSNSRTTSGCSYGGGAWL